MLKLLCFFFLFHSKTISKKENKALPSPDDTDKVG